MNTQIHPGDSAVDLMFYSIWCSEPWVGLDAKGPWHTEFDALTRVSIAQHRAICKYIPKRAEPASAWTVERSRVPLLAIEGGADPQDPIENFPRLKDAYPNGRAIVVPHYGHSFDSEGCLAGIVTRFVQRGSAAGLGTRCVGSLRVPSFALR
jgi:pimeloyl-ACP methyl ester carboxylesterase